MNHMIGSSRVLALSLVLTLVGCFSYVPADIEAIPPGQEVRMVLTRPTFASLPEIPSASGPRLNGTVVGKQDGGVLVRVPAPFAAEAVGAPRITRDIPIPQEGIIQMERRRFDLNRTALAVAVGLIGAAALLSNVRDVEPPITSDPQKPVDEEAGVGFSLSIGVPF